MAPTPPKMFAIGDVHGCAEELKALIHKLPLDQDTTILFLGDYVDRGPDAKGVIDTVLDLSELYKVIALKGNHEWLFSEFLENPKSPVSSGNFILNGGSATLASYSHDGTSYEVPATHRNFLKNLRLYHETDTHFFVHAGIPPGYDFSSKIDAKLAHQFLWIRNVFLDSKVQWPKLVVHGHTPVEVPEVHANRINLDTGCVFGRRLTAMNVSTGELYSVERNQVERPTFLTHTLRGGRARAQRFEGAVGVEFTINQASYPFLTVNYNEFGLLVRPSPGFEHLKFSLGEQVQGKILPGGDNVFGFKGSVVRVDLIKDVPHFGIKFEHLENLSD